MAHAFRCCTWSPMPIGRTSPLRVSARCSPGRPGSSPNCPESGGGRKEKHGCRGIGGGGLRLEPGNLEWRISGQVSEWLKEHAWKACVRLGVPWVRIPPCPLPVPGCSAAWLARLTGGQEVDGSNPSSPIQHDRGSFRGRAVVFGWMGTDYHPLSTTSRSSTFTWPLPSRSLGQLTGGQDPQSRIT